MKPVDLRSDTVTRPTPGMRRAIAAAEVGDDVFGDDALTNRLEAVVAERAGKEAAMRAWLLFLSAHRHADAGLWKMAAHQYCTAGALDPVFAWSVNDAAWMVATSADPGAHHGDFAVAMAVAACQARLWGNWSMLDTLAAAYARDGDFARAVPWQEMAVSGLPIIPSHGRRVFPTHLRQGANDGSGSSTGRRAGRELRGTGPAGGGSTRSFPRGSYGARVPAGHGGTDAWSAAVGGSSRAAI